jgi:hypothetical protein
MKRIKHIVEWYIEHPQEFARMLRDYLTIIAAISFVIGMFAVMIMIIIISIWAITRADLMVNFIWFGLLTMISGVILAARYENNNIY